MTFPEPLDAIGRPDGGIVDRKFGLFLDYPRCAMTGGFPGIFGEMRGGILSGIPRDYLHEEQKIIPNNPALNPH